MNPRPTPIEWLIHLLTQMVLTPLRLLEWRGATLRQQVSMNRRLTVVEWLIHLLTQMVLTPLR